MNKYQVVWLIIRLMGLFFAYLTLVAFFGLAASIPSLFTLPKIDAPTKNANANVAFNQNPTLRVQPISPNANYNLPETPNETGAVKTDESITDKFKGENFKNFLWFLLMTALYGAITWYLLRDGRILYDVLNREQPHGIIKEKDGEVTTLNLSDKQN